MLHLPPGQPSVVHFGMSHEADMQVAIIQIE